MEDIIDEIVSWKAKFDSPPFRVVEVFEVTFDACRVGKAWPTLAGLSPWLFDGMTNKNTPMWAVVIGKVYGDVLGFVWATETSRTDVTVQEITGV